MSTLNNLPIELHYNILYNLKVKDILELCLVNKFYKNICNNILFWKTYYYHLYNQHINIDNVDDLKQLLYIKENYVDIIESNNYNYWSLSNIPLLKNNEDFWEFYYKNYLPPYIIIPATTYQNIARTITVFFNLINQDLLKFYIDDSGDLTEPEDGFEKNVTEITEISPAEFILKFKNNVIKRYILVTD